MQSASPNKPMLARLKAKSLRHWVSAALILLLARTASEYIYEHVDVAHDLRDHMFQWVLERDPRPLLPRTVKVVLVDDGDYWLGEPGGRRPIKRDYLAKLVNALDQAN